nr:guanine nucleotide-binding protein subunit alpha-14-like [Dermatophagoides farinae]
MCIESIESKEKRKRNEKIEKILKETKSIVRKQVKLLLLGTGESGKSTFIKQMRIIHDNGFTSTELKQNRVYVFHNTIQCMQLLLQAMKFLSIPFANDDNWQRASRILSIDCSYAQAPEIFANQSSLSYEFVDCIKHLWQDHGVRQCYDHRTQFQLSDSAEYFFLNVERFGQKNYIPTNDDIVRIRLPTTGIIEHLFYIKSARIYLRIIDVGGQDNERMKWINCFEGVTSIIFLTALNEYDMYKYKSTLNYNDSEHDQMAQLLDDGRIGKNRKPKIETNRVNRMQESLCLFRIITSLELLYKTSFILFLNKKDLLEEKIKQSPLRRRIFDDFVDDNENITTSNSNNNSVNDAAEAGQFIKELFIRNALCNYNQQQQQQQQQNNHHQDNNHGECRKISNHENHHHHHHQMWRKNKTIYSHFTCATDTENIKFVFDSVKWTVLNKNMEDFGLH